MYEEDYVICEREIVNGPSMLGKDFESNPDSGVEPH